LNRTRRRRQAHLRHNGQPNRKWRKYMREVPDFTAMDAARRADGTLTVIGTSPAGSPPFDGEQLKRQVKLPPGELERIRARVDAHIAELEREGKLPT
jgi:hypothetical protein